MEMDTGPVTEAQGGGQVTHADIASVTMRLGQRFPFPWVGVHDCEDAVSVVLLKWTEQGEVPADVRSQLYGHARYALREHMRTTYIHAQLAPTPTRTAGFSTERLALAREELRLYLDRLTDDDLEVLLEGGAGKHVAHDLARRLSMTVNAMHQLVWGLRQRLRRLRHQYRTQSTLPHTTERLRQSQFHLSH